VFQFLNEKPFLVNVLALKVNAVPAVKEVFAIVPLVTVLVSYVTAYVFAVHRAYSGTSAVVEYGVLNAVPEVVVDQPANV
jgi:hypothetical protein